MTTHIHYQNWGIATTSDMMSDGNVATTKVTSRLVSALCDENRDVMPESTPLSQCSSGESTASAAKTCITGQLSNIEFKYHVDQRVLGTGHHGCVRECIDRRTRKRYAVKTIRKNDPTVKPDGLIREIMMLREMKHCSIVQLVDVFEDAEHVHIVTDLCKGGELFDRIIEKSSNDDNGMPCFTEKEAAHTLHQILTSVSYMHKHGIAHRDLKPENILFETKDDNSRIKIIDFGLARIHRREDPNMSTIVGTPYYIAPEVLRREYSKSCDLWSVGVVAYILLCGYPPFNGSDSKEVHNAVKSGRYHFDPAGWSGVSREAKDFVRRLLQKDPAKRMSVEMAFYHPWLTKHIGHVESRQGNSFWLGLI